MADVIGTDEGWAAVQTELDKQHNVAPVAVDLNAVREALAKTTPGKWRVGRQNGAPRDHLVDMGDPPKAPYFRMHKGLTETSNMRGTPAFGIVESDDASVEEIAANAYAIALALGDDGWLRVMADELQSLRAGKTAQDAVVARLREALESVVTATKYVPNAYAADALRIARAALANGASQ